MIFNENFTYDDIIKILHCNPKATETFRYFLKRTDLCFKNHIYHFICKDDGKFIGYGHLDYEDKLWLGMFISDSQVGKGYGKIVLTQLINKANQDIYLTVDKENISAVNLYLKSGFRIYNQTKQIYYCKLKK
jgi:RimJ/RimL family protein N-acetyltransferase